MKKIIKTDSENEDFKVLVDLLDEDLENRYGEEQKKYHALNKLPYIKDVYIAYVNNEPAACGAFKKYNDECAEIKRVYVKPEFRKQGLAKLIINSVESDIRAAGYINAILETGKKQPEAISLYQALGFSIIENYVPYKGDTNSVCMKKVL